MVAKLESHFDIFVKVRLKFSVIEFELFLPYAPICGISASAGPACGQHTKRKRRNGDESVHLEFKIREKARRSNGID